MELTYKELKKRDVINITDGRSLGKITDLTLVFPSGTLIGITVPGKKRNCIVGFFDRSNVYIEESKILKIGNDVILVDLKCGDLCDRTVNLNPNKKPNCKPDPCDIFSAPSPGGSRIDTGDY